MRAGGEQPGSSNRCRAAAALALVVLLTLLSGCASNASRTARSSGDTRGVGPSLAAQTNSGHKDKRRSAHARHSEQGRNAAPKHSHRRNRQHPRHHVRSRHRTPGVPGADLPNQALTPGVVLTTSTRKVCTPGYASSVRDVPTSESDRVYARYGVAHVPYAHEVDHLISLELGGSNAIQNLWPEPYAGRWGARTKDALENRLHDLVCSGGLSLRKAQHLEATNWVAAYRRFDSPPPPASPQRTHHYGSRPKPARATGGSCEPGYSPCLPVTSDLDCGDIPDSKTPVRVTGSDPYRLDADGDGWGCE